MSRLTGDLLTLPPLERFVRQYVDARDGVWDEIEPQVYDLLVGAEITRVAFDPEALTEHPQAQLASLGAPLLDRLLADAAQRWNWARLYRVGLNLYPRQLESQVRRAIALPLGASARVERVRAMNCPRVVFWFKATFASDQKEEEILPVGMDLHQMREVRNLDGLLAADRLSIEPEVCLPEARHAGLSAGYQAARGHVAGTVASLANARRREWAGQVEKQIARMSAYYAQLRQEAAEQSLRGTDLATAAARAGARRESIDREAQLRIAELRQKSAVQVRVKLSSVMVIQQPKLLMTVAVAGKDRPAGRLEVAWDPLSESVEAISCPRCAQPTFGFAIHRMSLVCERCQ